MSENALPAGIVAPELGLDDVDPDAMDPRLGSRFGATIRSWSEVAEAIVGAAHPRDEPAIQKPAAKLGGPADEDASAGWADPPHESPVAVGSVIAALALHHEQLVALGSYVRRATTVRDGVDVGPGPWHAPSCRWAVRAGDISRWEGAEVLPANGRLCGECHAGRPLPPALLPPDEQENARESIRDGIARLGQFVRRRAAPESPPGKWHAAGCRTTRTATDAWYWEGASVLPHGEDVCSTCLGRGSRARQLV